MIINEVNSGIQKAKKKKRLGRGTGSGTGKTSGRGHKGQGSRSGSSMHPLFEGGQMPLVRRIPKRGFTNSFADTVECLNVSDIDIFFGNGDTVSPEVIEERKIIKKNFDRFKVLGDGELTKSLTVMAHSFSKSAVQKIEAAGGKVVVLPGKKPVVKNKMKPKRGQKS